MKAGDLIMDCWMLIGLVLSVWDDNTGVTVFFENGYQHAVWNEEIYEVLNESR